MVANLLTEMQNKFPYPKIGIKQTNSVVLYFSEGDKRCPMPPKWNPASLQASSRVRFRFGQKWINKF